MSPKITYILFLFLLRVIFLNYMDNLVFLRIEVAQIDHGRMGGAPGYSTRSNI